MVYPHTKTSLLRAEFSGTCYLTFIYTWKNIFFSKLRNSLNALNFLYKKVSSPEVFTSLNMSILVFTITKRSVTKPDYEANLCILESYVTRRIMFQTHLKRFRASPSETNHTFSCFKNHDFLLKTLWKVTVFKKSHDMERVFSTHYCC